MSPPFAELGPVDQLGQRHVADEVLHPRRQRQIACADREAAPLPDVATEPGGETGRCHVVVPEQLVLLPERQRVAADPAPDGALLASRVPPVQIEVRVARRIVVEIEDRDVRRLLRVVRARAQARFEREVLVHVVPRAQADADADPGAVIALLSGRGSRAPVSLDASSEVAVQPEAVVREQLTIGVDRTRQGQDRESRRGPRASLADDDP